MALCSVIIAVLATILDGALMGLIAPAVKEDLGADAGTIGLMSSISMLMLAAFIFGGGTLGDLYGRKRFLKYGLIGLIGTSALAFVVPSAGLLIPVRALAGITSALINPLAMAIILVAFDSEERPKALGIYVAALGISLGGGTMVIAYLNGQFGWRATFGLVLALALLSLLMVSRFVKESKAGDSKRVDWGGIFLIAVGLFGIVYGINQAGVAGLASPQVLLPAGIGLVSLVILVPYSRKIKKNPALPVSLFGNKVFSYGVLLMILIGFGYMGAYFQLSIYLQALQKVSPFQAALTLLPYTLSMFVFAILAGGWAGKGADQRLITGGMVLMALGMLAMGFFLSPGAGFMVYLLPLILLGAGMNLANVPRTNAVLATAPPDLAGAASATNNAALQLGSSLGISILGVLFQGFARQTYFTDLADKGFDQATIDKSVEVLRAWLKEHSPDVAAQFGIKVRHLEGVIAHYEHAFTVGVSQVLWIGAAVAAVGAVLAWFTFRKDNQG
jgi:MFS family permease